MIETHSFANEEQEKQVKTPENTNKIIKLYSKIESKLKSGVILNDQWNVKKNNPFDFGFRINFT